MRPLTYERATDPAAGLAARDNLEELEDRDVGILRVVHAGGPSGRVDP